MGSNLCYPRPWNCDSELAIHPEGFFEKLGFKVIISQPGNDCFCATFERELSAEEKASIEAAILSQDRFHWGR